VVNANDRLVGAVTVDDVLDHLLPADWRDRDHSEPIHLGTVRAQMEPVSGGGEHGPGNTVRAQMEPVSGGGEHGPESTAGGGGRGQSTPA
jgi:hypothetical protein